MYQHNRERAKQTRCTERAFTRTIQIKRGEEATYMGRERVPTAERFIHQKGDIKYE